jgi:hypothetical protein
MINDARYNFRTDQVLSEHPVTIIGRSNDCIEEHRSEASSQDLCYGIMTENHYALAIDDQLADEIDRLTDFSDKKHSI